MLSCCCRSALLPRRCRSCLLPPPQTLIAVTLPLTAVQCLTPSCNSGFPIQCGGSSNKWVSRLTKSKKYGTHVVTADLGIMLGPGFPVDYSLQLGVRNDSRKWMGHTARRARVYPWEYALGDKAYVGCPEFLSEYKDYGSLDDNKRAWNDQLQFFRGRNEHLVAAIKHGRNSLSTTWRGSFLGLASVLRIVTHMVALEERMLGPRYDCFGPWPVCPDEIVRRYAK